MVISIDLPAPLEAELALEAKREGVTVAEQATLLLQLISTMTKVGGRTRFRSVVEGYLHQNSLDADRLADIMHGLISVCLRDPVADSTPEGDNSPKTAATVLDEQVLEILRGWRSSANEVAIESSVEKFATELPPLEHLIQRMGRVKQPSILGKYAYLGGGTEEFMQEKQEELDREDRR
jgi:hypothetical protein